jgi:LytR cell envelope-related transcriptional attenuator
MVFVLAFSLQGEVEKYGAYVGIASFIGLALLSILYFSQAREVRRLRDWAGRAPERDRELEQRVSAQADERRTQPAPARPQPAASAARPVTVAAEPPTEAPGPVAVPRPANGRAPAPGAIPMGPRPATAAAAVAAAVSAVAAPAEQQEAQAPEAEPEPDATQAHPVAEAAPADAPEAAPAEAAPASPAETPAAVSAEAGGAAPPPAETNGHGDQETDESAIADAVPRATPRQGAQPRRPAQPLRAPQRTATPGQRRQPAPAARRRPPARVQPAARTERHTPSRGVLLAALAGLIVVAIAALFATGVIGGGSGGGQSASQSPTPSPAANGSGNATTSNPASSPASRAATTVVVLNGTTVNGLAAGEKSKLDKLGYKNVQTTNSTNQAEQRSSVTYASGERRQAMDVAKALSISSVAPLDSDTQSLANNSFAKPVQADVVVIVGADQSP